MWTSRAFHGFVDHLQEGQQLEVAVPLHAAAEHHAGQDVEGGEKGRGAMALVIVGHGAGATGLYGQGGLGVEEFSSDL
jgi:hypothetical protein